MTTVLERPIVFDSVLATVAAVDDLSPHLRRVTFVAPRIADAVTAGPDQRIKVLLAPPNGGELKLPVGPDWYTQWCAQPADERFIMRTYTVRALRPDVPIIMMTAHGSPEDAARARELGVYRFIDKPFDVAEVVRLVEAAWAQVS